MPSWSQEDLRRIGETDDFHISPYREDGATPGTPTWTWSVVVGDDVYVRAYNGTVSRWYRAAMSQRTSLLLPAVVALAAAATSLLLAPQPRSGRPA